MREEHVPVFSEESICHICSFISAFLKDIKCEEHWEASKAQDTRELPFSFLFGFGLTDLHDLTFGNSQLQTFSEATNGSYHLFSLNYINGAFCI